MEYLCIILAVLLAAAIIKIVIMKIAAKEIADQLGEKMNMDTNTPVTLSSADRDMPPCCKSQQKSENAQRKTA